MFGTEALQVPDRASDITAKELTLKFPPNPVDMVEMLSGTTPSILVARMSEFGGLEMGYILDTSLNIRKINTRTVTAVQPLLSNYILTHKYVYAQKVTSMFVLEAYHRV